MWNQTNNREILFTFPALYVSYVHCFEFWLVLCIVCALSDWSERLLWFAKLMYWYHNNLLPPLFFNFIFTNGQTHGYSTRTADNYRVHHCRNNLKKFTILHLGPKIWNSLLLQSLLCQVFPILRKSATRVLSKIITELAKPHTTYTALFTSFYLTVL